MELHPQALRSSATERERVVPSQRRASRTLVGQKEGNAQKTEEIVILGLDLEPCRREDLDVHPNLDALVTIR